ncbi:MAG TPA: ferritin-like domain-containing protein [Steroidobacteraceae bacterium]|nr:ferritin-like domain-containing protein [Steroidobacteraceae bacterium]
MNDVAAPVLPITREHAFHALYEAAELEHNLMCTYLYAAFSLKDGVVDGLSVEEAEAVKRWRSVLIKVAVEEMGHLTAVWNITAALGGAPRSGRTNFPLDPGSLPAGIVVKLAPFNPATLQHFVFLERPTGSTERDGEGFAYERSYIRGSDTRRLTPMGLNYDTVGDFYIALSKGLREIVSQFGEDVTFDGDPALQMSPNEIDLMGAKPVICLKTALAAFDAIVVQGEGAPSDSVGSHYQKFVGVREEYERLLQKNPGFVPAFPAATNPVLRRPPRPEGRVWLENSEAIAVVDLANASYGLMLRLLAYAYSLPGPSAEKALTVDLAICLMRAVVPLAERAARLPAGPSNPGCHAGMSFTALRDSASLPPGRAARRFFVERFGQLATVGESLRACGDPRAATAADLLTSLSKRATRGFDLSKPAAAVAQGGAAGAAQATTLQAGAPRAAGSAQGAANGAAVQSAGPSSTVVNGIETAVGQKLELSFETKRCIHARFCVTGAPNVFLANVKGPWIHPDAMEVERVVEVAHACPSGAISYHRLDGVHDETAPPVNLAGVREAGPYAFRGQLQIDGEAVGFRATLCRCGASKNKPFCDGSHHDVGFSATGEPPSGKTDMLPVRDGVLAIEPEINGPLAVRGNLEITSGTGRVVARVMTARLCRCGGSASKPFCDGTHAKIGFKSTN